MGSTNELANAVSKAIYKAMRKGVPADAAACIAARVAADYARMVYGDSYLESLCAAVRARAGRPLPAVNEGEDT